MKRKFLIILTLIFSLSMLAYIGCAGGNNGEYTLEVNSLIELNIYDDDVKIYTVSNNPNENVKFKCESDVISVLEDGTIIANKFGQATVEVSCGNIEKNCIVNVLETDEIPVIKLNSIIEDKIGIVNGDAMPLDLSLMIGNKTVKGNYSFAVENPDIISVSEDGVVTAKTLGKTTLTIACDYKIWTVEKIIEFESTNDVVVRLTENRLFLSSISGVVGFYTNKTVEFVGAYDKGAKIDGATVSWKTMNENVATVENGVITAVGNGRTTVVATFVQDGKEYNSFVLVDVGYPTLESPKGFILEDGKLSWLTVDGADGYVVSDGINKKTINTTSLKLVDLYPANNYFKNTVFSVYAYSGNENVLNSEPSKLEKYFETVSYTDRLVKVQDTHEAKVEILNNQNFSADTPIYKATCTSTSLPGKSEVYGYLFRKVYFTEKAASVYGASGTHGNWCVNSLINPSSASTFYNSKITFWVFAERKTSIMYVKMDQMWSREVVYKQDVEPYTWTKFTCSISQKDFPYLTMLSASGDFYFTDFRISTLTYLSNDYSGTDVSVEKTAEVIKMIDNLPNVESSNSFGNLLKTARDSYEELPKYRKTSVTNYNSLIEKENTFGELVYGNVKSNSAFMDVESKMTEYMDSYNGVTLTNCDTFESMASEISQIISSLNSSEYYGLIVKSEIYSNYINERKDYTLVEDTRGNIKDKIISSSYAQTNGTGFVEINNGETAPNVANALIHPMYGTVLTMGTNPRVDTAIRFKYKQEIDLDGYSHVVFAVKNPRPEKMGVYLYGERGRVKALATDIEKCENYAEYTQVVMTVEEFMQYDISFGYNERPVSTASIWFTKFIGIKFDSQYADEVEEINQLLLKLSGDITVQDKADIDRVKELYQTIPESAKMFVNSYPTIIKLAEEKYQIVAVEEKISSIGTVSATETCINKINDARTSYDALDQSLRNKVTNYEALISAEKQLSELLIGDEEVSQVSQEITTFLNGFNGVTLDNYIAVSSKIAEIDGMLADLTPVQKYAIKNLTDYNKVKSSYKIIDNMKGTDIASRFSFNNGSNGINNGDTAPNIASALNHATYGACATIGKNSNGLTIRYNASGLDLSGYTHVIVGVKNNLGTSINIVTTSTERSLASNVENGSFSMIKLTVEEFLSQGIAIYTGSQGSIWLTSIIAINESVK